jgi:GTP-binding protein HflX
LKQKDSKSPLAKVGASGIDHRDLKRSRELAMADGTADGRERALLVGVNWASTPRELSVEYLEELDMLAQTAGAFVVAKELARKSKPDPGTLLGKGKVAELATIASESDADLVVFDDDLTPAQARNLEKELEVRVIDRTGLILDIFARRARTREAKTQVELAQLRYILPRLTRAWTHLERQQGGIGMRGPGETQIETDRRLIRDRIRVLEAELKHIERIHETQRSGRTNIFRFALAGYTNVGKSTLMNALTGAGVYEENLLFATLDSTTRALQLAPKYRALLTDTVGFIRKLPHGLVASFRSTLAEIREADCILHVVDLSSPSFQDQMAEVDKILAEMGLAKTPHIYVFNKVDALEDDLPLRWVEKEHPDGVFVSARDKRNLTVLQEKMRAVMAADMVELSVDIPAGDGLLLSELHRLSEVLEERHDEHGSNLRVRMPLVEARRLKLVEANVDNSAG